MNRNEFYDINFNFTSGFSLTFLTYLIYETLENFSSSFFYLVKIFIWRNFSVLENKSIFTDHFIRWKAFDEIIFIP